MYVNTNGKKIKNFIIIIVIDWEHIQRMQSHEDNPVHPTPSY